MDVRFMFIQALPVDTATTKGAVGVTMWLRKVIKIT